MVNDSNQESETNPSLDRLVKTESRYPKMETDGSSPMYPMAPDYISKCVNSLKRATNVFFVFFFLNLFTSFLLFFFVIEQESINNGLF